MSNDAKDVNEMTKEELESEIEQLKAEQRQWENHKNNACVSDILLSSGVYLNVGLNWFHSYF